MCLIKHGRYCIPSCYLAIIKCDDTSSPYILVSNSCKLEYKLEDSVGSFIKKNIVRY